MKISLQKKNIIMQIPLYLFSLLASFTAWEIGNSVAVEQKVVLLNEMILKSKYYISEMGSAVKGMLLEPTDNSLLEQKKNADENNSRVLQDSLSLTDDPEIIKMLQDMSELDEKKLNTTENEIMDLIGAQKITEAQDLFRSSYANLRKKYDAMAEKVAKYSGNKAREAAERLNKDLRDNILLLITFLVLGSLFISIVSIFGLNRVSRALSSINKGFTGLYRNIDASSDAIHRMSQELSESSAKSSAAIQESVSAMSQMSSMLSQTSHNTNATSELSKIVLRESEQGVGVMEEMSQSMRAILEASSYLKEIIEVIQNISSKTNVINDVVLKSQLLSVNASIEAARAGHHGKGFAVVAGEVASLATLSGKSSSEIRELLEASSIRVKEIIEKTSDAIRAGEIVSAKSSEAFLNIAKSVSAISQKIEQIKSASKEQEIGVSQTTMALSQLNEVASATNTIARNNTSYGEKIATQSKGLKILNQALNLIVLGGDVDEDQNNKAGVSKLDLILGSDGASDSKTSSKKIA